MQAQRNCKPLLDGGVKSRRVLRRPVATIHGGTSGGAVGPTKDSCGNGKGSWHSEFRSRWIFQSCRAVLCANRFTLSPRCGMNILRGLWVLHNSWVVEADEAILPMSWSLFGFPNVGEDTCSRFEMRAISSPSAIVLAKRPLHGRRVPKAWAGA